MNIHYKSVLVGFAAAVACAFALGNQQAAPPLPTFPHYQLTVAGGNLLVLDNVTNRITLLYKKGEGAIADRPWAADSSFSLEDAISKPEGGKITPGPGR